MALQVLYQLDLTRDPLGDTLASLWEGLDPSDEIYGFARELVVGVREELPRLDALLERTSENWRVDRMPLVDRNILRLAVFEFLHCPEIPDRVTINEAIELGKRFGTEETGAFVNGVLDQVRILLRAERDCAEGPRKPAATSREN
jgi:N utilization substance protein B